MSDKQFSIDDILNEYSKKRGDKQKTNDEFNLDEFISSSSTPKKGKDNPSFDIKFSSEKPSQQKNHQTVTEKNNQHNIPKETSKEIPKEIKAEEKPVEKPPQNNSDAKSYKATLQFTEELPKKLTFDNYIEQAEIPQSIKAEEKKEEVQAPSEIKTDIVPLKPLRKSSGNTEIIEGLLKMKRERANSTNSKKSDVPPINRKKINDIDLDIKSKIIPKTEQISLEENATEEQKMHLLAERRNKKIRDFVLNGDEDSGDNVEDEDYVMDDFKSFEDTPSILDDILQLKGNLIVRLCFLLITSLLSVYIVVANDFNWPLIAILDKKVEPTSYLFVCTVLGLLSAFVSYTVISIGFKNLLKLKADGDSISSIALIASLISAMAMLTNTDLLQRSRVHIYISIAIVSLLFNTLGKLLIVSRTERNFKYVSGEFDKYALFNIHDEEIATKFTKGALNDFPALSSIKKTEFVNDFLKNSYSADMSDSYCKLSVPIIVLVSLVATLLAAIFNKNTITTTDIIFTSLSTFAGSIAICSSFALMLVVNLPLSKASKKYLESSAVMLGYSAVDEYNDTNSVLLDVGQLFPEGMVDFVNLKPMSSTSIEEGILVAASLACHAGSILKSTFFKMLRGKTEMLYPVESYIYEDSLGLSGWIENKRVLLGTRELMVNHSIEGLPSKAKEMEYSKGNAVILYLSISGEISTLFIVQAKASVGVVKWIKELEKNNITIVLRSVDSIISLNFISELFDVSPNCLKLLPFRLHREFEEQTTYVPNVSTSMLCSGRFQSFAMLIIGAKRLHKISTLGISFQLAAAALGAVIAIIMTLLSSFNQLTATVLLAYNMAWVVLTLIVQSFKKV